MAIFLIRPGETEYDVQKRLQGSIDLPLTEHGEHQVDELVDEARHIPLDRIYTSPTEPALSTARRIAAQLHIPCKVLDSLTNVDLGLWQGLCIQEVRTRQPRVFKQWAESPETVCPPCGEDGEDACVRVAQALKRPLKRGGAFAIVASEPLASLIECHLQGREPELSDSFCQTGSTPLFRQIDQAAPAAP